MNKVKINHPHRNPSFVTGAYSNEFDRYNKVYAQYFTGIFPARTTVQSVLAEGIKVEIDCIVKLL